MNISGASNNASKFSPTPCTSIAPCPIAAGKKITFVEITSIQFISDHKLMLDNESDYKATGKTYPPVQWTPSNRYPISHSTDQSIVADVTFNIGPVGADTETVNIVCIVDGNEWFRKDGVTLSPGTVKLRFTAPKFTAPFLLFQTLSFQWKLEKYAASITPGLTQHEIAFTAGTPVAFSGDAYAGDAITYKRISKALLLLQGQKTTNADALVKYLMTMLGTYTLSPSPSVPGQYLHPTYFNGEGGAWPMMDYLSEMGECQAIVRFVGDVIKQVGLAGTIEMVYVFANPSAPRVAVENTTGNKYYGYALVDQPVILDTVYPPDGSVGFNNFEACLKFTDKGTPKYYGGGTSGHAASSKQEILRAFAAFVEITSGSYKNPSNGKMINGIKIVKILATNNDW